VVKAFVNSLPLWFIGSLALCLLQKHLKTLRL